MSRIRLLSIALAALLAAGLLAACGGDDAGDEDPQEVIDRTFSGDKEVNSAVVDLTLSGSAEGQQGGSLDASLNGPVQGEGDEFPRFDLTATLSAEGQGQSFDFTGGAISTGDAAFVNYQDTDYEVPNDVFQQFKQSYEQSQRQAQREQEEGNLQAQCEQAIEQAGGDPAACDFDPAAWLTNLENEGTEDVEGTETVHVSGDANVSQIMDDLSGIAAAVPGGQQIPEEQLQQIEDAVTEARIDVFSGTDDDILRRLNLTLALEPTEEDAAAQVDSVNVDFALTLSQVNEEQTVEAPEDARPFEELTQQLGIPGLGALGGLGGTGGAGGAGGGGGGAAGGDEALRCLEQAETEEEINRCLQQ